MAESLGDKLKRIAAEKKAARELADKQASAAGGATPEVEVAAVDSEPAAITEVTSNEQLSEGHEQPNELGTVCGNEQPAVSSAGTGTEDRVLEEEDQINGSETNRPESKSGSDNSSEHSNTRNASQGTEVQSISVEPVSSVVIAERTTSDHPLSMQFAEMEQALLTADPTFKTILRDVHRQLGNDPELVTMMTEDEIALVVKGLLVHANADIIEPAKAKTVKKAVAEAKKKAISADDL